MQAGHHEVEAEKRRLMVRRGVQPRIEKAARQQAVVEFVGVFEILTARKVPRRLA